MKKSHIASYENSDRDALAESDDPHALIEVLLNELVRHMQSFLHHFEGDQEAQVKRNTHFSKSLSIIYALQKKLDFDNGGEVAESMCSGFTSLQNKHCLRHIGQVKSRHGTGNSILERDSGGLETN